MYTHAAHYNLGLCLEFQRKYKQAAHHFEQYYMLSEEESDRLDGAVRFGYNFGLLRATQSGDLTL